MTDRELLELAHRAAGYGEIQILNDGSIIVNARRWNPLFDDGDAMRLAVKLRIDVEFMMARAIAKGVASWNTPQREAIEELASEECAAVRRAIVRVAAEIGSDIDAPQTAG